MRSKIVALGILFFGLMLLSGCATPQVLIAQGFAGERVVRYTIQKAGQGDKEEGDLFNLRVRLCNQGDNGSDENCRDSMLLQNVRPDSVY